MELRILDVKLMVPDVWVSGLEIIDKSLRLDFSMLGWVHSLKPRTVGLCS